MVVIADDLHGYNMINRGVPEHDALRGARILGDGYARMVARIARRVGVNVIVKRWRDLTAIEEFVALRKVLSDAIFADAQVRGVCDEFVAFHIEAFHWHSDGATFQWEWRYLLEEIVMSVFVTEVLGYSHELWEKVPMSDQPDPLGYIYSQKQDWLRDSLAVAALRRRMDWIDIAMDRAERSATLDDSSRQGTARSSS